MSAVILPFPKRRHSQWRVIAARGFASGAYLDLTRFDYRPNFSPMASGFGNARHQGHHGLGQMLESGQGDIGGNAFVSTGSVTPFPERAFGGVQNVSSQGDRLVELHAEMGEQIAVERFEHGQTPCQMQNFGAFLFGHLILRGLIARIKAVLRGRVE